MPRSSVRRSLARGQAGQILVMFLIFLVPMTMITFSVYNVGIAVSEKMKLQNAADNAAYSAATYEARYMNLTAYINRAMVANYDTIALLVGIWSSIDALDGFMFLLHDIVKYIPIIDAIDAALAPAHIAMHQLDNFYSQQIVGGNGGRNTRFANLLEKYTKLLSVAQEGLYITTQLGRGQVVQAVARGVDPSFAAWTGAEESFNMQSLQGYVKWKKAQDVSELSDKDQGLRLTIESSLNDLSNGGSFRDLKNLPVISQVFSVIDAIPCLKVNVGPHGFDGPGFDHVKGGQTSAGEDFPDGSSKVRIVNNDKIYQLDESNIFVGWDCLIDFTIIDLGHKSDDKFNLPNAINLSVPHMFDEADEGGQGDHAEKFIKPNVGSCSTSSGGVSSGVSSPPSPEEVKLAQNCQNNIDTRFRVVGVVTIKEVLTNPPESDPAKQIWVSCDAIADDIKKKQKSMTGNFTQGDCATVYNFDTPLDQIEFSTFTQDKKFVANSEPKPHASRIEGPGIYVHLRKQTLGKPMLRGLGLEDDSPMEAYSFARVYYTQRPPGQPAGTPGKESLFNPFWAGRLERLFEGDDE